jgi:Clp amino terminal domain, pathogenicity island component
MEPISRAVDVTRPSARASGFAHMEARRLGHHYLGPEHLLVGTDLPAQSRRERVLLGLPDHGPQPVRLLVEGDGRTLQDLLDAPLAAMGPTR